MSGSSLRVLGRWLPASSPPPGSARRAVVGQPCVKYIIVWAVHPAVVNTKKAMTAWMMLRSIKSCKRARRPGSRRRLVNRLGSRCAVGRGGMAAGKVAVVVGVANWVVLVRFDAWRDDRCRHACSPFAGVLPRRPGRGWLQLPVGVFGWLLWRVGRDGRLEGGVGVDDWLVAVLGAWRDHDPRLRSAALHDVDPV